MIGDVAAFASRGHDARELRLVDRLDRRAAKALEELYADRLDDMAATLAALKEQGIEPEREPYRLREGGSLLCFVRDPDEYRIELIERSGR